MKIKGKELKRRRHIVKILLFTFGALAVLLLAMFFIIGAAYGQVHSNDPEIPELEAWTWDFNNKNLWIGENLIISVTGQNNTFVRIEFTGQNVTFDGALITDENGTAIFTFDLDLDTELGNYVVELYTSQITPVLITSINIDHEINNYQDMSLELILEYMGFESITELNHYMADANNTDLPDWKDDIEETVLNNHYETRETRLFLMLFISIFGGFAIGVMWSHRHKWGEDMVDYFGTKQKPGMSILKSLLSPDSLTEYGGHVVYSGDNGPVISDDFQPEPEFRGKNDGAVLEIMEARAVKVGYKAKHDSKPKGKGLRERAADYKDKKKRKEYEKLRAEYGPKKKKKIKKRKEVK